MGKLSQNGFWCILACLFIALPGCTPKYNGSIQSIRIEPSQVEIEIEESVTLTADIIHSGKADIKLEWVSENPDVANITRHITSETVEVTGSKSGRTTIKVLTDNIHYSATCRINVVSGPGHVEEEDKEEDNTGIWDGTTAKSFAGGTGSSSNPYIIKTGGQLLLMEGAGKSYFKLMNDIDLGDRPWPSMELTGHLDGNGYTISNLYISHLKHDNIGFTSTLSGSIRNLTIQGVDISASSYDNVGGFAGYISSTGIIENCTLIFDEGSQITGKNNVGSIAGYRLFNRYDSDSPQPLRGCEAISRVDADVVWGIEAVGGLIGSVSSSDAMQIKDCHVDARIRGEWAVGGIIGYSSSTGMEISQCSYTGNISGGSYVAGILGFGHIATIVGCKADVTLRISKDYGSGIAQSGNIYGCYTKGTMIFDGMNGLGFAGISHNGTLEMCYSVMTSDATGFDSFGQYCTATYCATTASSKGTLRNCAQQCDDIAGYMISAPSEFSNLLNFNNLWEYYDQSRRINISCPKLKWEK